MQVSSKLCRQFANGTFSKTAVATVDLQIEVQKARLRHLRSLEAIKINISGPNLHHNKEMAVVLMSSAKVRLTDTLVAGNNCNLRVHRETGTLISEIKDIVTKGCRKMRPYTVR